MSPRAGPVWGRSKPSAPFPNRPIRSRVGCLLAGSDRWNGMPSGGDVPPSPWPAQGVVDGLGTSLQALRYKLFDRTCRALPPQLFDPRHHVPIAVVDPVELDEDLVGGVLVVHGQVGAAEVIEQAAVVLLAEAGGIEASPAPLHGR